MHLVKQLLRDKPGPVETIAPDATVLDAARQMNRRKIGSLVVVDKGAPVGIFTERDILTRVVAEQRPPAQTRIADVMTRRVITCTTSTPLDELRHVMRQHKIRHIPVVENGQLLGIVSITDLNKAETEALSHTVSYLEAYITH